MKVIIDISKDLYNRIFEGEIALNTDDKWELEESVRLSIMHGKVLPKVADIKAKMASEIIEQIEKMRQKEPYHFLPNLDAYNLFQKIVEDYRDGKGAWAERGEKDG